MKSSSLAIIITAFISLMLAIFISVLLANNIVEYYPTLLMANWLLYALFPVFTLYYFFPDNKAEGTFWKFTYGGSIAAFLGIWLTFTFWYFNNERPEDKIAQLREKSKELKINLDNFQAESEWVQAQQKLTHSTVVYKNMRSNREVVVHTGDIGDVKGIEIWVNSENNYFQMARFFDPGLSGRIRYLGAKKDIANKVIKDTISSMLNALVRNRITGIGALFPTGAGELEKKGVQKIYHIATVQVAINNGATTSKNIGLCYKKCFEQFQGDEFVSILLPLLGTGNGLKNVPDKKQVKPMVAKSLIEELHNSNLPIGKSVNILAYSQNDLDAIKIALAEYDYIKN